MTAIQPILVQLTQQELHAAKQGANLRSQLARLSGVANQQRDDRSGVDLDYLGIRAETAVAKIFQTDYDPRHLGVDAGVDMWLGQIGIDVKATFHEGGRLLFKSADAFQAHVAVLATSTSREDVINVVGFLPKPKFIELCTEFDVGKGKGLAVEQRDLFDLRRLWAAAARDRLKIKHELEE